MTGPGQGGDPSRFIIMTEVNPWTPQEHAEQALLYRGAIVAACSNVETWLSEWALRASHADAYRGLRDRFPYKLEDRIGFLERVLKHSGPLQEFAPLGLLVLVRVRKSAELRNRMAHARMRIVPDWGITFEELVGSQDGVTVRTRRYSLSQLQTLARRNSRLSRLVQRASYQIDATKALPPLHSLTSSDVSA